MVAGGEEEEAVTVVTSVLRRAELSSGQTNKLLLVPNFLGSTCILQMGRKEQPKEERHSFSWFTDFEEAGTNKKNVQHACQIR